MDDNMENFEYVEHDQVPGLIIEESPTTKLTTTQRAVHDATKPLIVQVAILTKAINDMQKMMNTMYTRLDSLTSSSSQVNISTHAQNSDFPALPSPELESHIHITTLPNDSTNIPGQVEIKPPPPNPAYDLANRCLGFYPISKSDVEKNRINKNTLNTPEEHFQKAGSDAIRDYLVAEMKMSVDDVSKMNIKRVFYPLKGESTENLFAEFTYKEDLTFIRRSSHHLKNNNKYKPRLTPFVPRSLVERYQAVEKIAFEARKSDPPMSTKIWVKDTI